MMLIQPKTLFLLFTHKHQLAGVGEPDFFVRHHGALGWPRSLGLDAVRGGAVIGLSCRYIGS